MEYGHFRSDSDCTLAAHCVNAHAALVEACRAAAEVLEGYASESSVPGWKGAERVRAQLLTALAAAESKE